eukprot:scaffold9953_cov32-Tisochrysis_lutea.AAC.8
MECCVSRGAVTTRVIACAFALALRNSPILRARSFCRAASAYAIRASVAHLAGLSAGGGSLPLKIDPGPIWSPGVADLLGPGEFSRMVGDERTDPRLRSARSPIRRCPSASSAGLVVAHMVVSPLNGRTCEVLAGPSRYKTEKKFSQRAPSKKQEL